MGTTVPTADPAAMLDAVLADLDQVRQRLARAIGQAVLLDEALGEVEAAADEMRTTVAATRHVLDPS